MSDTLAFGRNAVCIGRNAVALGRFVAISRAQYRRADLSAPEEVRGLALETMEQAPAPARVEPSAPARPDPFAELDARIRPDPSKRQDPFAELEARMKAWMDPIGEVERQMDPFAELEARMKELWE